MATKEDLVKTIVKYGPIKNIKLEQDRSIISETKEKKILNRGFGYVLFKKPEYAQKTLESLAGIYIIRFKNYLKPSIVDNFIPKDKRYILLETNYYNISNTPMLYILGSLFLHLNT